VAPKGKGKAAVKSEESENGSSADEKPAEKVTAVTTKSDCSENDSSSEEKPAEKAPAAAKAKAGAKPKAAATKGKKNGASETAHHDEADEDMDEKPTSKTAPKKLQVLAQKATNGKKATAEVKVSNLLVKN